MIDVLLKNFSVAWPSLIIGALIPGFTLLALYLTKKREQIAFKAALYGFATFFIALITVVVLVLLVGESVLPTIAISGEADADVYINIFGIAIILIFYIAAEMIKYFTFQNLMKQECNHMAGLTFGCGFILAQNTLVFGVVYFGEADLNQAFGFGVLMLISAVIYLLISAIGYQLTLDHHRVVGPVLAGSYYLMFLVMLLFANMVITYSFIGAVLLFNLVMGYVLLPHPFKPKKRGETL